MGQDIRKATFEAGETTSSELNTYVTFYTGALLSIATDAAFTPADITIQGKVGNDWRDIEMEPIACEASKIEPVSLDLVTGVQYIRFVSSVEQAEETVISAVVQDL